MSYLRAAATSHSGRENWTLQSALDHRNVLKRKKDGYCSLFLSLAYFQTQKKKNPEELGSFTGLDVNRKLKPPPATRSPEKQ